MMTHNENEILRKDNEFFLNSALDIFPSFFISFLWITSVLGPYRTVRTIRCDPDLNRDIKNSPQEFQFDNLQLNLVFSA